MKEYNFFNFKTIQKIVLFSFVFVGFFALPRAYANDLLSFSEACTPATQTITVGAVGDLLMHGPLQMRGYATRFENLWRKVQNRINEVDIMYANLETPTALGVTKNQKVLAQNAAVFDKNIYSGYPAFNTHPSLVAALKSSSFHVLSTANNHSMDRGPIGVDKTIDALEKYGLAYTGTRRRGTRDPFVTYVHQKGFKIAFLACTFSLNGIPDPHNQVLDCYAEKQQVLREIAEAQNQADAVIVTPHWGVEYVNQPSPKDIALGKEFLEAGALAVLGTHPHVIQPIKKHITSEGREGLIVYSTGNFISNQKGPKKIGLMVFLGLSKDSKRTWINGVRYSPLYMGTAQEGVSFLDQTEMINTFQPYVQRVMGHTNRQLAHNEELITNFECFNQAMP